MKYLTIVLNKGLKTHKAFDGACLLVSSYYQSLLNKQRRLDEYTFVKDESSLTKEQDEALDRCNDAIVMDEQWFNSERQIKFLFGTKVEIFNLSAVYEDSVKIDNVGVLFPPMAIDEMPSFLKRYVNHRLRG